MLKTLHLAIITGVAITLVSLTAIVAVEMNLFSHFANSTLFTPQYDYPQPNYSQVDNTHVVVKEPYTPCQGRWDRANDFINSPITASKARTLAESSKEFRAYTMGFSVKFERVSGGLGFKPNCDVSVSGISVVYFLQNNTGSHELAINEDPSLTKVQNATTYKITSNPPPN